MPADIAAGAGLSKNKTVSLSINAIDAPKLLLSFSTRVTSKLVKLVLDPTTLLLPSATLTVPDKFVQILAAFAAYLSASYQ